MQQTSLSKLDTLPSVDPSCMYIGEISRAQLVLSWVKDKGDASKCANFRGHEFTGVVDVVGEDVKEFKKGDKVISPFTVSWLVI